MSKKTHWLFLAAFIALSFLLYSNTVWGEFLYDDIVNFFGRPELREPSHWLHLWIESYLPNNKNIGGWRPLSIASFALNFIAFGESPVSFHLTNILLNGAVCFLIYRVVLRLFRSAPVALFSALLFALFPIHTAAVASMKARDELLVAFFSLLGWLAFLHATEKKKKERIIYLTCSCICVFLAMLSKETATVVPLMFLAVYAVQHKCGVQKKIGLGVWMLAPVTLSLLLRWLVVGSAAYSDWGLVFFRNPLIGSSFWTGMWTAFAILSLYITKTFIPMGFSASYAFNHFPVVSNPLQSIDALMGMILLTALLFLVGRRKLRATPVGIGALIFLVNYVLISRFILKGMGGELIEEHWIYFPSMGLALIAGSGLAYLYKRWKWISIALMLLVAAIYTPVTIVRNRVWQTEQSFYEAMLRDAPNSVQSQVNMAILSYNNNNITRAKKHATIALGIYPEHHLLLNLLGKIALMEGNLQQAEDYFRYSLSVHPTYPNTHKLFARTLAMEGRYLESLHHIEPYMRKYGDDPELRFLAALNLYKLGHKDKAAEFLDWNLSLPEEERWQQLEEFGN